MTLRVKCEDVLNVFGLIVLKLDPVAHMETDLLIIGAGPFGLSLAAQAAHDGIEHLVVGKPMEFWRRNMKHPIRYYNIDSKLGDERMFIRNLKSLV